MQIIPSNLKEFEGKRDEMETLAKEQKEYKLIGSMLRRRGHQLFYKDLTTGDIGLVKQNAKAELTLEGDVVVRSEVQHKEGRVYCQALNYKNAVKKFNKSGY